MEVKPLGDRVLIRRAKQKEKTDGGLIIPTSSQQKSRSGEIVAVGEGTLTESGTVVPLKVRVGDLVMFGPHAGTEIDVDNEKLLLMRESDIYCRFVESSNEEWV